MSLFKKSMPLSTAALRVYQVLAPLPLRLRDRLRPFGLPHHDAFEMEGVALIFALGVSGIQKSRFNSRERDRLQDAFSLAYADHIMRRRITANIFELHPPLKAVAANRVMNNLPMTSHIQLELSNLKAFLLARLSRYSQGHLEANITDFLAFLEVGNSPQFELMFTLATFIVDAERDTQSAVNDLHRSVLLR